jgi:hypothetical protein
MAPVCLVCDNMHDVQLCSHSNTLRNAVRNVMHMLRVQLACSVVIVGIMGVSLNPPAATADNEQAAHKRWQASVMHIQTAAFLSPAYPTASATLFNCSAPHRNSTTTSSVHMLICCCTQPVNTALQWNLQQQASRSASRDGGTAHMRGLA